MYLSIVTIILKNQSDILGNCDIFGKNDQIEKVCTNKHLLFCFTAMVENELAQI